MPYYLLWVVKRHNCALDLARHGVLEKHGVELIGANEAVSIRPKIA